MKNIALYSLVCFVLIGCGGGSDSSGTNNTPNGGGNVTPNNQTVFEENNTTVPLTGIYLASDSEQDKYLKVINYARNIGRECKNNDGSKPDASKGSFPPAAPLKYNNDLAAAALEHSIDMASNNKLDHRGSGNVDDRAGVTLKGTTVKRNGVNVIHDGKSTFVDRIKENGYIGYRIIGENIAVGQSTIERVVHAWLESPGHCANIMNAAYKEMGLDKDISGVGRLYWSNEFGAKP